MLTMVTGSNSVYEQVTCLCAKILDQHTTSPLGHSSSTVIMKGLRALSYGILLNKSHLSYCCSIRDDDEWDALPKILAYSYKLHQCHLTSQAMKLYDLLNILLNSGWGRKPVLLFLANLAEEVQDNNMKSVSVMCSMLDVHVKPYEEFPPQTFELPLTLDMQKKNTGFVFNQEPGVGLPLLGRFGGRQCIPSEPVYFADLTKPRDLLIPQGASPQELQDEGYVSPSVENTMTWSCVSNTREYVGSKVWEMAVTVDQLKLRTWDTIGCLDHQKENPFFTESGVDCVQKVWRVTRGHMVMYMNTSVADCLLWRDLSRKELIWDLKLLLIGVPSQTFQYNQVGDGFVMESGICVEGVTPEMLCSFCEDFLVSGTCYLRLKKLVERNLTTGSHMQEGLMFQALCRSVHCYLQFYRSAVMMISEDPVLTRLRQQIDGLHIQMSSLGHLCKVHPKASQRDATLPEGVALLAYLYQEICKVTRKDIICVLYSALQGCCQVYFSFLQKWMFEGLCQDTYTEFFIQQQTDLITCRQRDYWSHGYYMLEEAVPGFLQGLEGAIFQCGKALNLLKVCNPQDALCVVLQSGYPNMRCCLHSAELEKLEAECLSYQRTAVAACGQPLDLSHFFRSIKEEEQQTLLEAVQVAHQASLQRLKLERDMKTSQALAEKQSMLAVLKKQMQIAEACKMAEIKQQVEEDERRARQAAEIEAGISRRIELEKVDLVHYYSALSEVPEKRSQLAKWQIERMKLKDKRLDLKDSDMEYVTTMRSPNNNECLQDVNSNLCDMNILNSMQITENTETGNINVDTQSNTETSDTAITNYKMNITDVQNNTEASDRQSIVTNCILETNSSGVCLTRSCGSDLDEPVDSETSLPLVSRNQVTDNAKSKVKENPEQNRRDMSKKALEVIMAPQSFLSDEENSEDRSMACGTAIAESERCMTVLTESKLSVTNTVTDKELRYRLQMSLDDAPLVNITDSVVHSVNDSMSVLVADVDRANMSFINITLQKSILIPLKIQTNLVNSALLRLFLQDEGLLSHLHSLRSYFFLLDGEFGRNMTSMLFERMYHVACPVELLNFVTLNSILSKALTRPDSNMDRLSFDVKYIPPYFSFSSPHLLDCIMLKYRVAWPLNIIFTDAALHKYNDIFGYLLRLCRISWVLEEDFRHLKREGEDRPGLLHSSQYHCLQLYRHEMTHFVHALQNYMTATVLEASWVEFLQNLKNANTLDDLYRMHVVYIKMVLFRCLLNKQSNSIQKALLDTLRMILKFHGQIHSQAWHYNPDISQFEHPRFSTLVQIYDCFHKCAVFTFKYATKLANKGYQPHLLELVQMLNMNGFYPEHS